MPRHAHPGAAHAAEIYQARLAVLSDSALAAEARAVIWGDTDELLGAVLRSELARDEILRRWLRKHSGEEAL